MAATASEVRITNGIFVRGNLPDGDLTETIIEAEKRLQPYADEYGCTMERIDLVDGRYGHVCDAENYITLYAKEGECRPRLVKSQDDQGYNNFVYGAVFFKKPEEVKKDSLTFHEPRELAAALVPQYGKHGEFSMEAKCRIVDHRISGVVALGDYVTGISKGHLEADFEPVSRHRWEAHGNTPENAVYNMLANVNHDAYDDMQAAAAVALRKIQEKTHE